MPSPRRVSRLTPVPYKTFEKFLLHVGCQFVRQKGDHRIYRKPGLIRPLVIPAERSLPAFIIRNNLRVMGISTEEYLRILLEI